MAVTRDGLPKLVLVGAAAAPALLLFRALLLLRDLWRHDVERAVLIPVAAFAAAFGLAAALLLLALRLPPDRRANLALAVGSAAAAAYAAELALSLWSDELEQRLAEKLQLAEEMGQRGLRAYPSIEPVRLVWARAPDAPSSVTVDGVPTLPLSGRARSTVVECQDEQTGDWLVYETDEHGFHNPPGLWGRAPVALAAVGDSFTAGHCVASDANMVAGLLRRFPTSANLGVAGNGPLLTLAVLREYLPALRPRVVLWCHFAGNDLLDLRREKGHPLLRRYLEGGSRQGLIERRGALDHALDAYLERDLQPALRRLARGWPSARDVLTLRSLRSRLGLGFADLHALTPTDNEYALFRRVLARARETVAEWDGTLHFVYLPAGRAPPHQIGEGAKARVVEQVRARTLSLVRELGLPVIDVQAAFSAHPDPDSLFACPECHYNVAGYRVAADAILAELPPPGSP